MSSDLSPPSRASADANSKKRSHLHGLHHSHKDKDKDKDKHKHKHHHHRSSRHHAKEFVQSAFPSQPPTSFGDLLKQAKESISSSPSDSRRGSVAIAGVDGAAEKDAQGPKLDVPPRRRPVRPEDLERETKRAKVREQYVLSFALGA